MIIDVTSGTNWYRLQQTAHNISQISSEKQTSSQIALSQDLQIANDSQALMAAGSHLRIYNTPFWHFRRRVVMQQARELSALRSGDVAGRAQAIAWKERHDSKYNGGSFGSYVDAIVGNVDATFDEITVHFAERFANADALERRYHQTHGTTGLLRKAAKIRARALTELGFFGIDPISIGEGGIRAVRSGLIAKAITQCFGIKTNAIGIALSIATSMTSHISALSTTLNEIARATTKGCKLNEDLL